MRALLTVALTGLAVAAANPAAQQTAEPGDLVEHTFRTDFLGDPGPAAVADLRGRPVLIDFWGTR